MTRFQFTLRGILWATFWAAVSMGAWACFAQSLPLDGHSAWPLIASYFAGLAFACSAIGALFRRTVGGLVAGLVLAGIAFPIVFFILWSPP